ncbi:hypothetical protein ES677_01870 [Bizionia gelidisalsuginis]|uniref:Lipoprotein n=1 Tax=Bizionia gelidisalsuginis TaxID=291188 RepID=A0ABY3MEV9_9FLAO|nr:hypothetical protein [Bizionia gelidisalsuginis]TYC18151.1 hypothetical protein ES677_01870 [Bizionia gelidisalsuginis]
MKKLIIIFALSFSFFSCDKDDTEILEEDYASFLEKTTPQFSAHLGNEVLNWRSGFAAYQSSIGYLYPDGDQTHPHRYLRFILNEENGDNQFLIRAPLYDTSSETEFTTVFGQGIKTIGKSNDDFYISIKNNNYNYAICNSDAKFQLEILKTEEITNEYSSQKELFVWIKIEKINLNDCNFNYNKSLNNGLILAKFYGHKFE